MSDIRNTIIITNKVWIPEHLVNIEKVKKNYLIFRFEEQACVKCDYKADRPYYTCDTCPAFTGKYKLYARKTINGKKYIGLHIGDINNFTKKAGLAPAALNNVDDQRVKPKIKYDISFTGELRDHQKDATKQWFAHKYGQLMAPPRSGKTVLAVRFTLRLKVKTLILVHQGDLLDQMLDSFYKFTDIKDVEFGEGKQLIGIAKKPDDFKRWPIVLSTYQKFISEKGKQRLEKVKRKFGLVIIDECFPQDTYVLVDHNKAVSIREVYKNPNITHVLSYDLENKKIEKRKILRKIALPVLGKDGITLWFDNTKLSMTSNHKVFVKGKGYIPAHTLKVGDYVIVHNEDTVKKIKICKTCGEEFDENSNMGSHNSLHNSNLGGTCEYCGGNYKKLSSHIFQCRKNPSDKVKKHLIKKSECMSNTITKFLDTPKGKLKIRNSIIKMTKNNPTLNPDTRLKIGEGVSKAFWKKPKIERDKQVKRFMSAPNFSPLDANNVEQKIISLKINGLHYMGTGEYFVTLDPFGIKRKPCLRERCLGKECYSKDRKYKKNPDFIFAPYKCGTCSLFKTPGCPKKSRINTNPCIKYSLSRTYRSNKVIEVMDLEYWHCKSKANLIKRMYKKIGVECLILDAKLKIEDMRSKIHSFIDNHYERITKIEKFEFRSGGKTPTVYNLEVEGNHNYFALATTFGNRKSLGIKLSKKHKPILVSNCHKIGADCFSQVLSEFESRYRLGFTATPKRKDRREFLSEHIIGPVTSKVEPEQVIPKVFVHLSGIEPKYAYKTWTPAMQFLARDKKRMKLIAQLAVADVLAGHSVLIPVVFVKQATELADMIDDLLYKKYDRKNLAIAFTSRLKDRKTALEKIRKGKIKVVVGIRSLIQAGLNVPRWSSLIEASPISNVPNFTQETARIRTPAPELNKPQPIIRHILDENMGGMSVGCFATCFQTYKGFEWDKDSYDIAMSVLKTMNKYRMQQRDNNYDVAAIKPSRLVGFDDDKKKEEKKPRGLGFSGLNPTTR